MDIVSIIPQTITDTSVVSANLDAQNNPNSTVTFTISQTNWINPSQSMVVRIQQSLDAGTTWDDLLIATVPNPNGLTNLEYSYGYVDGRSLTGLVRLLCEVTGSITFNISGVLE